MTFPYTYTYTYVGYRIDCGLNVGKCVYTHYNMYPLQMSSVCKHKWVATFFLSLGIFANFDSLHKREVLQIPWQSMCR